MGGLSIKVSGLSLEQAIKKQADNSNIKRFFVFITIGFFEN
ncbi:hypothetical protein RCH33_2647 [Flavobacterium daejeonense]|nr:hypothetical protein RCH33_2647 [Flavobacterium daejeonense]